jgi:outer membrane biosynthesis protein TonB
MKATLIFLFSLLGWSISVYSQTADIAFHSASNHYIHEKDQEAKRTLDEALQKYPNDPKLRALRAKIKEDEKKKEEKKQEEEKKEQEKKEKEKQDQQKKDQDKKDQKGKDKEDQKGKEEKDKEQKEKDKKEKEQKEQQEKEQQQKDEKNKDKKDIPPSVSDKLKDMQITEEKAKMILEAMKNQEVQYLQQNKRKATKPRDKGKPDW